MHFITTSFYHNITTVQRTTATEGSNQHENEQEFVFLDYFVDSSTSRVTERANRRDEYKIEKQTLDLIPDSN
jgi:hypothetical protein